MPTDTLVLIGAGEHAKVVLDAFHTMGKSFHVEARDDNPALDGRSLLGCKIKTPVGSVMDMSSMIHVAIGNNKSRIRLGSAVMQAGKRLFTIIHARATVSVAAHIDDGVFLAAAAVVAPGAQVGTGAIINHGAIVDHDCRVGAWTHIAPNAVLGGTVRIGEGCLIGSGAVVLPGLSVGDWAIVGAGAVVTKNVEAGAVVTGVPARVKM